MVHRKYMTQRILGKLPVNANKQTVIKIGDLKWRKSPQSAFSWYVSSIGRGFQTCNFRGFFLRVENAPEQSKNGLKVILSTGYQSSKKKAQKLSA